MFKRANKVTALLVAAASVMSIVPAMASTRLGVKDGHIKGQAFAYDDGKYIYDGYRTNDDDEGIYYNNGSEDKEKPNDDLKDYELVSKYGTKYAYAKDNNDQYLVDLSTGKIVDEDTPEDKADKVKSDLRSKLKKADRYAATGSWDSISLGDTNAYVSGNGYNLNQFSGQFGEVWYQYFAGGDKNNGTNIGSIVGNTDTFAKFTVQLPATVPTGNYAVGSGAPITPVAGRTKAEFAQLVLQKLVADNQISTVFDVTTFKYDATSNQITGTAKNHGPINSAVALSSFTVVDGLGATTTGAAVTTGASAALEAVVNAEATRLEDDVIAAKILVEDLTDATTKNLYLDRLNKILTIGKSAPISATTMAAVNILAANPKAATLTTYVDAGISGVVADGSEVDGFSIGVTRANNVLAAAIANGTLGDGVSDAYARYKKEQELINNEINKTASSTKSVLYLVNGKNASNGTIGLRGVYTGFVNDSNKYIDASATANMYIYSQAQHKTVKVKEFDKENKDYGITVTLESLTALAQDKDYIYALAQVAVKETGFAVNEQYFIQKLSKAQGDDKEGAYLPKSVDSYQVDPETIFKCGDSKVVYNFLVTGKEDGFDFENITAKDGNLYITGSKNDGDKDKVKVFKIVLKKDKIDAQDGKEDRDVYIAKKDGDSDIEIKEGTRNHAASGNKAIAYDVDGNTWVISKGTITKFNGTEKKEMYTTDRSFDHLDVYNENNLIAWDQDSEVYTTVQEGTKKTQSEATAVAPAVTTGWVQGTDGTWTFNDATGTKLTSKWIIDKGYWYYLKADGVMATGWLQDPNGGAWYYLNPSSGAMLTGWLKDPNSGLWYYLNPLTGAMLSNTTVDGYQLGGSGAWIQ